MKNSKLYIAMACLALLCSCEEKTPELKKDKPMTLSTGRGKMVYTAYAPLADKPVKVYYYIPEGNVKRMPILFAMHGADRNAEYQIDTWCDIAEDKKVIVIAPEFTKALYPEKDYQYVGVSSLKSSYKHRDESEWTINIVEKLFDWMKDATGNESETYDLWGHSAGSQFSHRTTLFSSRKMRVGRVVCSNAGAYTVPDPAGIFYKTQGPYPFPYSIRGTEVTEEDLASYFGLDLTVHLGNIDTVTIREPDPLDPSRPYDTYLPTAEGALAQGPCRYERGKFFFATAKAMAEERGVPFNWKMVEVNKVGHSSRKMVQNNKTGAAILLYGDR